MLATYLELWRQKPVLRRILVVSLFADIAFGALVPFVNFYLSDELKRQPMSPVLPSQVTWQLKLF